MRKILSSWGDDDVLDCVYDKNTYHWRPGERKRIKRRINKAERREARKQINKENCRFS